MDVLHLHGTFLPDAEPRDGWVVNGTLTFEPPPAGASVVSLGTSLWMIPGLVDAHCHVGIAPTGRVTGREDLERQALQDLDAGALLLRDVGSPVDTGWMRDRHDLPRLIRAGRHVARTRRYIRDHAVEVEPDELAAEVERQLANADGWVKVATDWIDRDIGDLSPTFPLSALSEAVARAHRLGARVAVHAFGEEAAAQAIEAGVDSIEHATGLTGDMLDAARQRGLAIVPTLVNIDQFHGIAALAESKYSAYARHMRALFASSRERVRAAWEAGIPIYVGTDAGGTLPHGLVRSEIAAIVGAGVPLDYVVAQASWAAREWLGLPGLVEGAPADLVVYADDPRRDLAVLYAPRQTILRGTLVTRR